MIATPTIAIIDDDKPLRDAIENLLLSSGYNAITYASAERFLDDIPFADTSLSVCDIKMGEMSGLVLQTTLINRNIDIPIIFISAVFDGETAAIAFENGATACLRKPFDEDELISAIRTALER